LAIRLDHLLLGGVVAALDALGELDLLGGREERHLADVLEEQLQRVGRDLARLGLKIEGALLFALLHDLDVHLLERRVELVELERLEVVPERKRDLVVREKARLLPLAHERLGVLVIEQHDRLAPLPLHDAPNPLLPT
jgi:hypothetical protein